MRFFGQKPEDWRDRKGKFKTVMLPPLLEDQFRLFRNICVKAKRLADRVTPAFLDTELLNHGVTAPKTIDNAIVNYVKIVSGVPREAP